MLGIVMLGASNSGKSTIGRVVAMNLGLRYISSGDIARQMNVDTELAKGKLAPEEEMRKRIIEAINSSDRSFILDGFPRFYDQYEWLKMTTDCEFIYIIIDVPDEQLIQRANNRGRGDDNAIATKLEFWYKQTVPMINDIINTGEVTYNINNADGTGIGHNIQVVNDIVKENIC